MAEKERNDDKTGKSEGKPGQGKRILLRTFGCQMNTRDSEVIAGLLMASGYRLTAEKNEADILIFNTCSVRQHAEERVWSEIGSIVKQKKRDCFVVRDKRASRNDTYSGMPIIGIVGCMAQNYKEQIFERCSAVNFVVGPSDIHKLPEILDKLCGKKDGFRFFEKKIWETESHLRPEEIYHTGFYQDKEHAFVVISEGCSNFCSYCVVPYTRGALRHRGYNDILKEIERGMDKGISKITLLGQNVNAYKCAESNFIKLAQDVNSIKGLKSFSFLTSHPKDTSVELFKAMAELEKLKKHLHLPVQSGSDKILKSMNRGYNRKFYLDLIKNYRKIVKGGLLSTDIIVGFPGETEKDFQDTYDLVEKAKFSSAYIFKYSPRPNTAALGLSDDVSKEEKERRHKLILDLQKKISKKQK